MKIKTQSRTETEHKEYQRQKEIRRKYAGVTK